MEIKKVMPKFNLQLFAGEEGDTETQNENTNAPAQLTPEEIRAQIRMELAEENRIAKEKKDAEEAEKAKDEEVKKKMSKAKENLSTTEEVKKEVELEKANITISNLRQSLQEALDMVEEYKGKYDKILSEQRANETKIEVMKRVEKEPYLKNHVENLLKRNLIKSIEDYDAIIDKTIKDELRESWEIRQKNKDAGRDPQGDYKDNTRASKGEQSKVSISEDKKAEIKRKLGIR